MICEQDLLKNICKNFMTKNLFLADRVHAIYYSCDDKAQERERSHALKRIFNTINHGN